MNKIRFGAGASEIVIDVEFSDNPVAKEIVKSLPIESKARIWGNEIYFDTGVTASDEGATMDVATGDIAYWPDGKCLCIFFGRTPASSGDKPVPAGKVVLVGKTSADRSTLGKVKSGFNIRVE